MSDPLESSVNQSLNDDIQNIKEIKQTYQQIIGVTVGLVVLLLLVAGGGLVAWLCFVKKKKSLESVEGASYIAYNTSTIAKGLHSKDISLLASAYGQTSKNLDDNNNNYHHVHFADETLNRNKSKGKSNFGSVVLELKDSLKKKEKVGKDIPKTEAEESVISANEFEGLNESILSGEDEFDSSTKRKVTFGNCTSEKVQKRENKADVHVNVDDDQDQENEKAFMDISREICLSNDLSNLVQAFDDMINSVGSNDMEDIDLDTTASVNNESQQLSYQNKVGVDQKEHDEKNILNVEVKDEEKILIAKSDDCVIGEKDDDGDVSKKIEDESMCSVFSKDQDIADDKVTDVIKDDETSIVKIKAANSSEVKDSEKNNYPFVKILTNDKTASFLSQQDCIFGNANISNIDNANSNTNANNSTKAIENDNYNDDANANENANAIENAKDLSLSLESEPRSEFEFDEDCAGDLLDPKNRLGDLRKDSLANMLEWDSTFEDIKTHENSLRLLKTPAAERSTRSFLRGSCNDMDLSMDVKNIRCSVTKSRLKYNLSMDDLESCLPTSTPRMDQPLAQSTTPLRRMKALIYTPVYAHRMKGVNAGDDVSLVGTPLRSGALHPAPLPSTPLTNPQHQIRNSQLEKIDAFDDSGNSGSQVSGIQKIDDTYSTKQDSQLEQSLGSSGTPVKQDTSGTPAKQQISVTPDIPESKLKLSFVADSSGATSSSQSKVHDTFSSSNDSQASSMMWDNSADLLQNGPSNFSALPNNQSIMMFDNIENPINNQSNLMFDNIENPTNEEGDVVEHQDDHEGDADVQNLVEDSLLDFAEYLTNDLPNVSSKSAAHSESVNPLKPFGNYSPKNPFDSPVGPNFSKQMNSATSTEPIFTNVLLQDSLSTIKNSESASQSKPFEDIPSECDITTNISNQKDAESVKSTESIVIALAPQTSPVTVTLSNYLHSNCPLASESDATIDNKEVTQVSAGKLAPPPVSSVRAMIKSFEGSDISTSVRSEVSFDGFYTADEM